MKTLLLTMVLVFVVSTVYAVDYTVTITAGQDTALQKAVDEVNAANGTAVTKAEYADKIFKGVMKDTVRKFESEDVVTACDSFRLLSGADKTTIRTLLSGVNPCRSAR